MKLETIKQKIKENRLNICIVLLYAIITLIISLIFHEKWRDEAQAWMIARDLDFIGILKQMKYEGHPPLWHLILMPFAKLGFPYITESVISWLVMCVSVWLIWTRSPFKIGTKILITLTTPIIYSYTIIARNYCLIPLALSLIAINYPERENKPIQYSLSILLLAYTHILMLGLVGILYYIYFMDQLFYKKKTKEQTKKVVIALIIAIIGLALLAVLLFSSVETNSELPLTSILSIDILQIYEKICRILQQMFGRTMSKYLIFRVCICLYSILLIIWQARKNYENLIIGLTAILWQMFIYLFIYDSSEQKVNSMLLICIFIAWLNLITKSKEEKNKDIEQAMTAGCLILLLISNIEGVTWCAKDVLNRYSNARIAAEYIEENLEEDAIFICTDAPYSSAIIPYTENKKFWNPSTEEYFTYMVWDEISNRELSINEIIEKVQDNFNKNDNIYLLDSHPDVNKELHEEDIEEYQNKGILSEIIYKDYIRTEIYEEMYEIYKINL